MSFSVSRFGAGAPINAPSSGPGHASGGSLLSVHAEKCCSHFNQSGNGLASSSSEAVEGVSAGPSGPEDAHERQLGNEVNHMSRSTPVQGANPLLAGSLGSGSLLGSFSSSSL